MTPWPSLESLHPSWRPGRTLARPSGFDKPRFRWTRSRLVCFLLVTVSTLGTATVSAAQAPDEAWRTLETDHFRITFAADLEDLARRAGDRAERAYAALADAFIDPPEGKIDLVVSDHTDAANGFATIFPSNRVTVIAKPPVGSISLQFFDDWLDVLIVHELVHVFHLDRTGGLGRVVRSVFGRVPLLWPAFPETLAPTWTIEGLATHFESSLTGSGRSRGTYHDMVVRAAALEGALESLDQVSGTSPVWPAGPRPYVYGAAFFDYLVERHGSETVTDFVRAVGSQWIPFRINSAARDAFGTTFTEAWDDWRTELRDDPGPSGPVGRPERILTHGRFALHPRVSPDGRFLALARSDGRSNSQLRAFPLGSDGTPESEGDKWARTNGFATFDWTDAGALVFAQQDFVDPYRSWSDLYRVDPDGAVTRLTEGARLSEPSVTADGTTAVAVRDGDGAVQLVEVDLETGDIRALREADPAELWTGPALSPDERWIAASRWTPGGFLDLVVLDREGRIVLEVTTDRASDTWPTWSPDGATLVWASDRTGVSNLYGVAVDPAAGRAGTVQQITNVATGIAYPAYTPDGRWIVASGYAADGWHVERVSADPDAWTTPGPLDARFDPALGRAAAERFDEQAAGPVRDYAPWRSLLPTWWIPSVVVDDELAGRSVIGTQYGVATGGQDLVGRHAWSGVVRYEPAGGRTSGGLSYGFAGAGTPILSLQAGQGFDADPLVGLREDSTRVQLFEVDRVRSASVGLEFPRVRSRSFLSLGLSAAGLWSSSELLDTTLEASQEFQLRKPEHTLAQFAATLSWSTVQSHAYSISGEDGVSLFGRARTRTELNLGADEQGSPGLDDSLDDVVGVFRAFKAIDGPGYARHTFALRLAGGTARGSGADRGHFDLGGASGAAVPLAGIGDLAGAGLLFPVRGYPEDVRAGRHAWTASAEYRFPLALVHRGLGAFPLYFDRLWGSLFFDAGDAWGGREGFDQPNPRRDALMAAGAELGVRFAPFWFAPLDLRIGGGMPLVETTDLFSGDAVGSEPRFWVRFGRSF